jgi:hypothetical protein
MTTIEVNYDQYGSKVRSSCLADYMELVALQGINCTFADLTDMIKDGIGRLRPHFTGGELIDENEDDDIEPERDHFLIDSMKQCLMERREVLQELYPFEVGSSAVSLRQEFDTNESPYVWLLAVTLIHAYDLDSTLKVDRVFEELVTDSLKSRGFIASNLGEMSRNAGFNFVRTIEALSQSVGIQMKPDGPVRPANANEHGTDIFMHLTWNDDRVGKWTFIGQATVGKSETWPSKCSEPKPAFWSRIMNEHVQPHPFFAVPHHVEREALISLTQDSSRSVLDRVRLSAFIRTPPANVDKLISTVMQAKVQTLRV